MCFSSGKILCDVALFAFVVLPCFECSVMTRTPITGGENGEFRFVDGVRRRNFRPLVGDAERVGVDDTLRNPNFDHDHYPFINRLRVRTGPLGKDDESNKSIGFADKHLRDDQSEQSPEVGFAANWMKDGSELSTENQAHFINGRPKKPTIPHWILARPEESVQVGYPFINGLLWPIRHPRQFEQAQKSQIIGYGSDSKPSNENYPYPSINGPLWTVSRIPEVDNAQKSVGLARSDDDGIFSFVNGLRKVEVVSSQNARRHYTYGKRQEGDRKVLDKILRKSLRIGSPEIVMYAEYDGKNEQNSCPVNFISVQCTTRACDVEKDTVEVVSGGVGETHFKVKIVSCNSHLYKYQVLGFTKCA